MPDLTPEQEQQINDAIGKALEGVTEELGRQSTIPSVRIAQLVCATVLVLVAFLAWWSQDFLAEKTEFYRLRNEVLDGAKNVTVTTSIKAE